MLFVIGLLLYILGLIGGILVLMLGVISGAYWQLLPLAGLIIGTYVLLKCLIWFLMNVTKEDVGKFTNTMKNVTFVLDQNQGNSNVSTLLSMLESPTDEFRQTYLSWLGHKSASERAATSATLH